MSHTRLGFNWSIVITLASLIFMAGGNWKAFQAQGEETAKLEEQVTINEKSIGILENAVTTLNVELGELKDDVKDGRVEQMSQRILIERILTNQEKEIRRNAASGG